MKRKCFLAIVICLLCVCLVLTFAACKNETATGEDGKTPAGSQTEQPGGAGNNEGDQGDPGDTTGGNNGNQTGETGGKDAPEDDTSGDIFGEGTEMPVVPIP